MERDYYIKLKKTNNYPCRSKYKLQTVQSPYLHDDDVPDSIFDTKKLNVGKYLHFKQTPQRDI
jgi:hypothetical protein